MPETRLTADPPLPAPHTDRLFAASLRSALEAYLAGDYRRAAERFEDAAAVGGGRLDSSMWLILADQLALFASTGQLTSTDASERRRDGDPQ